MKPPKKIKQGTLEKTLFQTNLFSHPFLENFLFSELKRLTEDIGATNASVWLQSTLDSDRILLSYTLDPTTHLYQLGQSFYSKNSNDKQGQKYDGLTGFAFETGSVVNVANVHDAKKIKELDPDLVWSDKQGGAKKEDGDSKRVRPFLAIPLTNPYKEESVFGIIRFATTITREPFSMQDVDRAIAFCNTFSLILQDYLAANTRLSHFQTKIEIDSSAGLPTLLHRGLRWMTVDFISIFLQDFDKPEQIYLLHSTNSEFNRNSIRPERFFYHIHEEAKTSWVYKNSQALIVTEADIQKKDIPTLVSPNRDSSIQCEVPNSFSWVGVPIVENGETVGVIRSARGPEIFEKNVLVNARAFSHADVLVISGLVQLLFQSIKNHRQTSP